MPHDTEVIELHVAWEICHSIASQRTFHGRDLDISGTRFTMLFATVNAIDQLNIMHFFLEQAPHPPPKPHDHTYISVERVDADNKYASNRYNL